jgi:hypothetical protein
MSSDDSKRQGSRGFAHAGIGMTLTFKCSDCNLPRSTAGRKKTRIGWRCVGCVRAKAEKVAA